MPLRRRQFLEGLLVFTVLALSAWAMIASMLLKSATMDEAEQLWAGYQTLTAADYSINPHPPLTKLLQAAPLVALGAERPPDYRPTPAFSDLPGGRRFLYENRVRHRRLLTAGRLVNVGLALLFMLWAYLLARRWYGAPGAAVTLGLLALSPNLAAHARLTTTDLGAAVFPTLGLATLGWALDAPDRRRLLIAGLALGLGLAAKLSTVYLLVAAPAACLLVGCAPWRLRLKRAALVTGVALLTLLLSYLLVHSGQYLRGLRLVLENRWAQPFYMLGELHHSGWWRYVLVVTAVKLPHAHQLVLLGLCLSLVLRRPTARETPLVIGAAIVCCGALAAPINFGVRHLLPAVCMGALVAGRLTLRSASAQGAGHNWRSAGLLVALALGSGIGMARSWPDYLAYYNELSGGPAEGHRIVIDTNLDMGQDLDGLARWVERQRAPMIYLCYFGNADPRLLKLPYRWVPGDRDNYPSPGVAVPDSVTRRYLAISVMYRYLYKGRAFAWLAGRQPVATIGQTIQVFDISGDIEAAQRLAAIYEAAGYSALARAEARRALGLRNPGH